MGSYRYCKNDDCGNGLREPTAREELLEGGQECPYCGVKQRTIKTIEEFVVELFEEIESLKEVINHG